MTSHPQNEPTEPTSNGLKRSAANLLTHPTLFRTLPSLELHRHQKLTEKVPLFHLGWLHIAARIQLNLRPIRRIDGALLCFQQPISIAALGWSEPAFC